MDDKTHLQKTIDEMLGKASGASEIIDPSQIIDNPVEQMTKIAQHLEYGLMQMSGTIQSLGSAIDVIQLQIQMTWKMLIEKEIVTKEELAEKYKTDVITQIEKAKKEYQEQMQKAILEAQDKKNQGPKQTVKESKPEQDNKLKKISDTSSNVILPSQKHETKVF